jgi:hypothetical protein
MNEYTANDIGQLLAIMATITRSFNDAKPWWRGQADKEWQLLPSLYRKGYGAKEANMNGRFRNMAKVRHPSCPDRDDIFSWLFLMQHYRLPTRLLDWSESPLVALFFALETEKGDLTDAALWALLPTSLNLNQLGKENICMPGSGDLKQICTEAFVKNTAAPDRRIISVLTEHGDLRHMVQQSAFTIHGCDTPIETLPNSDKYLAKVVIPGAAKPIFRQTLNLFGISRAVLFPDLENLALELACLEFSQAAEQGREGARG